MAADPMDAADTGGRARSRRRDDRGTRQGRRLAEHDHERTADPRPSRQLSPAPFDKRAVNLIANAQKHMAESFAPMPTKYTDVKGYATYYHYSGATTLPDVVPDFSRGRKIL